MQNSVERGRSRCPEKPADNSRSAIGKGFDAADALSLFNPKGAAKSFTGCVKGLVHRIHYGLRPFSCRMNDLDSRRICKIDGS